MKSTSKFMIVITALAMMFSHAVFGQEKFTIAGGAGIKQKSVYSDMLGTIATACTTDEMPVEEVVTSGGAENLRLIKGNKVKAAIIPSDLLEAARFENASSVANIQTLFTLHMEAEHLIVRADTKKEGGISIGALKNIGGDSVNFNNPEDLKERQVGAVGGSAITARVISDMLRYKWQVTDVPSTNELIEKLAKGELDAILISAGLQSEAVKAIKGNFKLLPLRGNSDTARIYKAVKVEYPNLNNGRSVDTLGARAIMVTRTWRDPAAIDAIANFRGCFLKNVAKIQDTTGTHAAWESVDPEDRGTWQWYNLPSKVSVTANKKK